MVLRHLKIALIGKWRLVVRSKLAEPCCSDRKRVLCAPRTQTLRCTIFIAHHVSVINAVRTTRFQLLSVECYRLILINSDTLDLKRENLIASVGINLKIERLYSVKSPNSALYALPDRPFQSLYFLYSLGSITEELSLQMTRHSSILPIVGY